MMRKIWIGIVGCCFGLALLGTKTSPQDMSKYQSETIEIEIKGEVQNPGVYELPWHATIQDAITAAGGTGEYASLDSINASDALSNRDVIVIPKRMEEVCISINSGSVEQLDTLPGIGLAVAQRIIDYRKNTPFRNLEDLKEVKGIGDKLFAKLQDRICL